MGDDLAFVGAAKQAEMVRAGEVSPRELVQLSLDRIARLDPQLNSFRKVFAEKALLEAEQAEARLKAGDERPLLGVPIAIKDEVDVVGEINTHGTDGFTEPAKQDSEMVRRLREAGAIVVGLTLLPEMRSAASPSRRLTALPATPGTSSAPPPAPAAVRARRSPPAWFRSPRRATGPARSASPPRRAASSDSSPRAGAPRWHLRSKAGAAWPSSVVLVATCWTRRSGWT